MNDTIFTNKMETYKITIVVEVSEGAFKHDNWIYRSLEECLEDREQLISYRMETV